MVIFFLENTLMIPKYFFSILIKHYTTLFLFYFFIIIQFNKKIILKNKIIKYNRFITHVYTNLSVNFQLNP
jgi:hypothetical protein